MCKLSTQGWWSWIESHVWRHGKHPVQFFCFLEGKNFCIENYKKELPDVAEKIFVSLCSNLSYGWFSSFWHLHFSCSFPRYPLQRNSPTFFSILFLFVNLFYFTTNFDFIFNLTKYYLPLVGLKFLFVCASLTEALHKDSCRTCEIHTCWIVCFCNFHNYSNNSDKKKHLKTILISKTYFGRQKTNDDCRWQRFSFRPHSIWKDFFLLVFVVVKSNLFCTLRLCCSHFKTIFLNLSQMFLEFLHTLTLAINYPIN